MRLLSLAWMALFGVISASTAAATETVLYSFSDANTSYPRGRLYLHDGVLFGTGSGDGVSGPGIGVRSAKGGQPLEAANTACIQQSERLLATKKPLRHAIATALTLGELHPGPYG